MTKFFIPFIIIFFVFTACTTKVITESEKRVDEKKVTEDFIDVKSVNDFFRRSERDVARAREIVISRDLVKNLTHLQNMNAGGDRYYLLERENITKMIKAVTENVYFDFILINKSGTVIYTMRNEEIFGRNVKSYLKNTALGRCYDNRSNDIHVEDVTDFESMGRGNFIFFSTKVSGQNTFPGIFILQTGTDKIEDLLDKKTSIIGRDGKYRISHNHAIIYRDYPYAEKLLAVLQHDVKGVFNLNIPERGTITFSPVSFKNIFWILLSEPN